MSEQNLMARRGISKLMLVSGSVLWAAAIASLVAVSQNSSSQETSKDDENVAAVNGTESAPIKPGVQKSSVRISFPARTLPDFNLQECMGGKLGLSDLKGKRWVASFVFTRCTTSCPVITKAVMDLHNDKRVEENAADVTFVSFTVDPKFDNVEILKTYSETWSPDRERWKFLTGSQQEIYELIVKGFGLVVRENLGESRRPGFEVAHSNRMVLVNEDGIPVGTFLGNREEHMVKLRRIVTGRDEFPQPGATSGLSFSTSDGNPPQIQFEVQPANTDESERQEERTSDEEPASGSSAPSVNENNTDSDSTATTSVSASAHNAKIDQQLPLWAKRLPPINAGLNTLAAILLICGLIAIRNRKELVHRNFMVSAFLTSAVFLACYLTYHYALGKYTGEHGKRFPGQGIASVAYQLILWPHIALAACVPVMAIRVFQHAFADRREAHRKLARLTFPIWMFVSVTGVIIYGMLYHWPMAVAAPAVNR
jgi:protein SCO1